jgi:hypothetical protein
MQDTPSAPALHLPCRHLRCKEMYYQGIEDDEYSSGAYWCARTQEPLGPDNEIAGKNDCCSGRPCYLS